MKLRTLAGLISVSSLLLTACTGFRTPNQAASTITPTTREASFPELKDATTKTGAFTDPRSIQRISLGMGKDQVRREIGNPHFSEGLFAVHEWDYAFNFYTGKPNRDFITCQYKVLYNDDNLVEGTRWKDNQCDTYINPKPIVVTETAKPQPAVVVAKPEMTKEAIVLGADGLFIFNKSSARDTLPEGRAKIDAFADKAKSVFKTINSVTVTGYTDRLGGDDYNFMLSMARAQTVRQYLIQKGFDPAKVHAVGMGKEQPVKECPGPRTQQIIDCLQPNRRVGIEVIGAR